MLETINNHTMLSDNWYRVLKRLVQVILPAVSSLYFGLGNIWGFPAIEEVVGSLAVVATFIGVCLGLSSSQYNASDAAYDGKMVVNPSDKGGQLYSLEFDGDPYDIAQKNSVNFKVTPPEAPTVYDQDAEPPQ